MRDCLCTSLAFAFTSSALRSRTLHVLEMSVPSSHILPLTLPTTLCNLTTRPLCVWSSLGHNRLNKEAKQALRNAWRGAPSQLEL